MTEKEKLASAFLFDLDGTLIDSLEDIASSMNQVLEQLGREPIPVDGYRYLVGAGVRSLAVSVAKKCGIDDMEPETIVKMYLEMYRKCSERCSRKFPGVDHLLKRLREWSIPLGILSNKTDPVTRRIVEMSFPSGTFAWVSGEKSGHPIKPDPFSALAFSRDMRVDPQNVFFVGDMTVDMQTALHAGMVPVGVSWGFRPAAELLACGAKIILSHPGDLLRWIAPG